jgi:hypothetical protein
VGIDEPRRLGPFPQPAQQRVGIRRPQARSAPHHEVAQPRGVRHTRAHRRGHHVEVGPEHLRGEVDERGHPREERALPPRIPRHEEIHRGAVVEVARFEAEAIARPQVLA